MKQRNREGEGCGIRSGGGGGGGEGCEKSKKILSRGMFIRTRV